MCADICTIIDCLCGMWYSVSNAATLDLFGTTKYPENNQNGAIFASRCGKMTLRPVQVDQSHLYKRGSIRE